MLRCCEENEVHLKDLRLLYFVVSVSVLCYLVFVPSAGVVCYVISKHDDEV